MLATNIFSFSHNVSFISNNNKKTMEFSFSNAFSFDKAKMLPSANGLNK